MLSFEELVAWWNLSHSLGGHCCTLLGALHGVRCCSQVCMYVRQSSCTLLACLHSPQLLLLAAAAASLLFFLFCFVFFFFWFLDLNPKRKFLNSYHMVRTIPLRETKQIPGKTKTCLAGLRECTLQDPSTTLCRLLCSAVDWKLIGFVRLDSWICGSFEFCTNLVCPVSWLQLDFPLLLYCYIYVCRWFLLIWRFLQGICKYVCIMDISCERNKRGGTVVSWVWH